MALRLAVANTVLGEAIQWLEGDGEVNEMRVKSTICVPVWCTIYDFKVK